MAKTVVILGASGNPNRFAHKAMRKLVEHGHRVILVNPNEREIEGRPVLASLNEILDPVDTLTIYLGPDRSQALTEEILDLRPQRVIFNPGAESKTLMAALEEHRIHFVKACTLIMLDSGQF